MQDRAEALLSFSKMNRWSFLLQYFFSSEKKSILKFADVVRPSLKLQSYVLLSAA